MDFLNDAAWYWVFLFWLFIAIFGIVIIIILVKLIFKLSFAIIFKVLKPIFGVIFLVLSIIAISEVFIGTDFWPDDWSLIAWINS